MRQFRLFLMAAGLGLAIAQAPASAAVDCSKKAHEIEILICKTPDLQVLDREIAAVYKKAVTVAAKIPDKGRTLKTLKAEQRGWIGERNDCWKETDQVKCTTDTYERRISWLQAKYMLVPVDGAVSYVCNGNPADEITASAVHSRLPSMRLERGDKTEIAIQTVPADGARFDGDFGLVFWLKGEDAQVTWPQGTDFTCKLRK